MSATTASLLRRLASLARRSRKLPTISSVTDHFDRVRSCSRCSGEVIYTGHHNELIPGRLVLGRYPYPVGPGDALTTEKARSILRDTLVLKKRINVWASLQEELAISPEENAAAAADDTHGPFRLYHSDAIRFSARSGLPRPTFLHFPIADFSVPSDELALRALEDMTRHLAQGRCVYLHCHGGRGRAGTMGALLLKLLYPELGTEEVLRRVNEGAAARDGAIGRRRRRRRGRRRQHRRRRHEGGPIDGLLRISPETDEQVAFVRRMSRVLAATRLPPGGASSSRSLWGRVRRQRRWTRR